MGELADWLEQTCSLLVESAANRLSQSEQLRATVVEAVEAFYDGLIRTVRRQNELPLNLILLDWVEARSAPTDDAVPSGLLPVFNTLKIVTWDALCACPQDPQLTISWLTELERIFSGAANYLVKLETEALLNDTRSELNQARNDIERLNQSKSDFIAVAAHELKTPLTLIEGYTNMLKSELPADGNPQAAVILAGIQSGTTRLRDMIQDLTDVSTIEMGLLKLYNQPVWLNRLVDGLVLDVAKVAKTRNLTISVARSTFPATPTYGDAERLYQAILKVVYNAIKYTPDGGKITLRARVLPGFTDIVVKDTGIGIDPDDLQHIFEKFSSLGDIALHSSGKTKFKGGGAGLGLAIAKGIIDAHGGTIWAESQGYDEMKLPGSAFHIMIPMRSAPSGDTMTQLFS